MLSGNVHLNLKLCSGQNRLKNSEDSKRATWADATVALQKPTHETPTYSHVWNTHLERATLLGFENYMLPCQGEQPTQYDPEAERVWLQEIRVAFGKVRILEVKALIFNSRLKLLYKPMPWDAVPGVAGKENIERKKRQVKCTYFAGGSLWSYLIIHFHCHLSSNTMVIF